MHMSPAGRLALIKREGKRNKAYQDSVGVWTIGVGHTAAAGLPKPKVGMILTDQEVDSLFEKDLIPYEQGVFKVLKKTPTQNQFDAMVSFAFNIGTGGFARSGVVKAFNAGNNAQAAKAFMAWVKPPELYGRRSSEVSQFLKPDVITPGVADNVVTLATPVSKSWYARLATKWGILPAPSVTAPVVAPTTPPDVSVLRVQKQLQDLGYSEVGVADGFFGPNTKKAILAFESDSGEDLGGEGEITDELVIALNRGTPKPVALARATATVGDLNRSGNVPAKSLSSLGWLGAAIFGSGGIGGLDQTGVFDSVKNVSSSANDTFSTINGALSTVASAIEWSTHHWWIFALFGGLFMVYKVVHGVLELVDLFRRNILTRAA